MTQVKSDYSSVAKIFDTGLSNVARAMDKSGQDWFVVAGWALDLFIGAKTREHKDIEVSVWRDQAPNLFKRFPENRIDMVTGHKKYETLQADSIVDKRGHLIVRDVSIENHIFDVELFTTERSDNHWIFRKQQDIQVPLGEAILTSRYGPKFLAPQLVLLYKAWFFPSLDEVLRSQPAEAEFIRKCWETDCADFERVLPLLSDLQREWIRSMMTKFTPGIPWLAHF